MSSVSLSLGSRLGDRRQCVLRLTRPGAQRRSTSMVLFLGDICPCPETLWGIVTWGCFRPPGEGAARRRERSSPRSPWLAHPYLPSTPAAGSCLISVIKRRPCNRGRGRARNRTMKTPVCSHLCFRASVISPLEEKGGKVTGRCKWLCWERAWRWRGGARRDGGKDRHGWKPRGGYLETDGESEDRITSPRFLT